MTTYDQSQNGMGAGMTAEDCEEKCAEFMSTPGAEQKLLDSGIMEKAWKHYFKEFMSKIINNEMGGDIGNCASKEFWTSRYLNSEGATPWIPQLPGGEYKETCSEHYSEWNEYSTCCKTIQDVAAAAASNIISCQLVPQQAHHTQDQLMANKQALECQVDCEGLCKYLSETGGLDAESLFGAGIGPTGGMSQNNPPPYPSYTDDYETPCADCGADLKEDWDAAVDDLKKCHEGALDCYEKKIMGSANPKEGNKCECKPCEIYCDGEDAENDCDVVPDDETTFGGIGGWHKPTGHVKWQICCGDNSSKCRGFEGGHSSEKSPMCVGGTGMKDDGGANKGNGGEDHDEGEGDGCAPESYETEEECIEGFKEQFEAHDPQNPNPPGGFGNPGPTEMTDLEKFFQAEYECCMYAAGLGCNSKGKTPDKSGRPPTTCGGIAWYGKEGHGKGFLDVFNKWYICLNGLHELSCDTAGQGKCGDCICNFIPDEYGGGYWKNEGCPPSAFPPQSPEPPAPPETVGDPPTPAYPSCEGENGGMFEPPEK